MMMVTNFNCIARYVAVLIPIVLFFMCVQFANAATLSLTPGTGVYTTGNTFTARIVINTGGQPVNAAEGTLSFNSRELAVVNVSRSSSIFNLWTVEPTFSNSAGTVTFGGGSPSGYTGSNGTVMTVTFRTLNAGSPRVTFSNGSVLAADGLGTNVLTAMNGGSYTVTAPTVAPEPETVYVPPANTPGAPTVQSSTHPDPDAWYDASTVELSWSMPSGITSVRTLLDQNPNTIPTIVYDDPISSRTITDLDEGVSYFHIQLRNADGWGRVTHFPIRVDTQAPTSFTISQPDGQNAADPEQKLLFQVEDTSPILEYRIQLDGADAVVWKDGAGDGVYTISDADPGRHTIIVEAIDSVGKGIVSSFAFDIASFDKPQFTEYPTNLNAGVIPVFKGQTRPQSSVTITFTTGNQEPITYTVTSEADGSFILIPDAGFATGAYDVVAVAEDAYGAKSEPSDTLRILVSEPGYLAFGGLVVSVLSVFIPVIALILILIFGTWYLWHRLVLWRRRVRKETLEAEQQLATEFAVITKHLDEQVAALKKSRKGKLTKAEEAMINQISDDLSHAQNRIDKEIRDIETVIK